MHSRNNFFPQNLIIDCIKKTWTITRRLRYTKVFVYFVDTFLILIHWIVIYLLDNRGLKYCILHLWFFKPLPTRDSLLYRHKKICLMAEVGFSHLILTTHFRDKIRGLDCAFSCQSLSIGRQVPRANQTPFCCTYLLMLVYSLEYYCFL